MDYEKIGALGFLEMSYSAFSEAITKPELRQSIMNFKGDKFTFAEKQIAAEAFTDAALAINVDVMPFGLAVQYEKVGGFAFSMKERFQWHRRETAVDVGRKIHRQLTVEDSSERGWWRNTRLWKSIFKTLFLR